VVLSLNALLNAVFILFDWPRESHQLAKLGGLPDLESFLFFFQACVAAPLVEEILFRGIILSWAIGGRKPKAIADVPAKLRPWLVAFAGVSFAVVSKRPEAIGFSLMLTLGLGLAIWAFPRKQRYVAAVFSTSAMFATFHSSVWPSPIPLFFLAMGLGWLAVRTRGILASAIVHGLFNAVSVVVVLSSAN
jgi:membrane protease YdiL (CAAX protease family)